MATVRIDRYEVEEDLLPALCMQCGAEATLRRRKQFSWHPPWVIALILVGLLPYVIVALVLTRRMTVRAPLCERHRHHWTWRAWFVYLGLAVFVVLGVGSMVLVAALDDGRGGDGALAGLLCGGTSLAGLAWLIAAALVQQTGIRPVEIRDDGIALAGVSRAFAEELWAEREAREEEEERRYRRRRARRRRAEGGSPEPPVPPDAVRADDD